MSEQDPFSILGMAASADPAAIKRAYFAALVRHPPHGDAEAFRRVRAAYELLSDPQARKLALLRAPLDTAAELSAYDAEWGQRLKLIASRTHDEQRNGRAVEILIERIAQLTFTELRKASGDGRSLE